MIAEGEDFAKREAARKIGDALDADYCLYNVDDHENVSIVLKFGEYDGDSNPQDIIDHIKD